MRLRTVKVCERCLEQARDAGYQIAEREPASNIDAARLQSAAS